jgi:hypothetical protein
MVEPEGQEQESEEAAEAADESEELDEQGKGGRRHRDFQANAVQNLQRARKSVTSPDADVSPRANMLVQSAIAWALLDLADAVRSHGQAEDEPDE